MHKWIGLNVLLFNLNLEKHQNILVLETYKYILKILAETYKTKIEFYTGSPLDAIK